MFLIYFNDISKAINNSSLKLFADDPNLPVIVDSVNKIFKLANDELAMISEWLDSNEFSVNYDKTNYIFQLGKYNDTLLNNRVNKIIFTRYVIDRIYCSKYLGVMVDDLGLNILITLSTKLALLLVYFVGIASYCH